MKKALWSAVAAMTLLALAAPARAQTNLATDAITVTVNVGSLAKLEVDGNVSFPDTDPDFANTMTAAPVNISARARVAPSAVLNVTMETTQSFFDPTTMTIPVGDLTWTASGAYSGGTLVGATPITLASWGGPAQQNGTQTFTMKNLWTYAPGSHVLTLTYTLSTP